MSVCYERLRACTIFVFGEKGPLVVYIQVIAYANAISSVKDSGFEGGRGIKCVRDVCSLFDRV